MKKKIRIYSGIIMLVVITMYLLLFMFGFKLISSIEKIIIMLCLLVGVLNIGIYILDFIKDNKWINTIISLQMAICGVFLCCIILKNYNTNMYMVNRNNNNFMMTINVNDNSKEYYLCRNKYIVYRECAIKEYLKNTTLSYEENTPVKIEYSKNIFQNFVDQEVLETQKKIISSSILENETQRIIINVTNYEELVKLCEKYKIENAYSKNYFENSSILVVSYIPFREVIPYIAIGEDNNIYVYIKEEDDNDFSTKSLCFIEYNKQDNIKDIVIEDYNNTMKNYRI